MTDKKKIPVQKRLVKVKEAAEYLSLSEATLYKKSELGEIPSKKIGRALRFDLIKLDQWIENLPENN